MPTALQLQHQQFLGDVSSVVLDLGSVQVDDNELLPEGITLEHLSAFENMYAAHCEVNMAVSLSVLTTVSSGEPGLALTDLDSIAAEDDGGGGENVESTGYIVNTKTKYKDKVPNG